MELKDISILLDEKLKPINDRLESLEKKVDNILAFVSVGNEDIIRELKKVAH